MKLFLLTKKFLAYNAVMWPVVMAVYAPYYIFILHYSAWQLLTWVETAFVMGTLANLAIQPIVRRVTFWVEKIEK